MAKLLVTGANGQLGRDLVAQFSSEYDVVGVDIDDCDITDQGAVDRLFQEQRPEIVLHSAAYTDVDGAESNEEAAFAMNERGTSYIANASAKLNAYLVYYSTDYVFDGTKGSAYIETDKPNPLTVYGHSKLAGERVVTESNTDAAIVRLSWLYSAHGSNFVSTIIRLGQERLQAAHNGMSVEQLKVVNDQYGHPTWTADVAKQTVAIIKQRLSGIVHCTAEVETTWFEFAREILKLTDIDTPIVPCTTDQFPRPAQRPGRSSLENAALKEKKINMMRSWDIALEEFITINKDQLLSCPVK